jgi:DNA-binding transcriptional MerR regulator
MDRSKDTGTRLWRIGELAKRTGLSVRALRHYDEIGLLVSSERSFSGFRLYSDADVRRLYQIVALRQLGLGLEHIREPLDGSGQDIRATVHAQLEVLDRERELQERLRARLVSILEVLDREAEPSAELFIEATEVTVMIEKYYTEEQREQLSQRTREVGAEAIEQVEREWSELIAAVKAEQAKGPIPPVRGCWSWRGAGRS